MRITLLSLFTLFIIIAISFACKSKKEIPVEVPVVSMEKGDMWAKIKSGPCFGRCPVYELTVFEGGFAEIKANKYLDIQGWQKKKLDATTYLALKEAFVRADFNNLKDHYKSLIADLPSKSVSLFTDGKEKIVKGKETLPETVIEILEMADQIVKADGWEAFTPETTDELPVPEEPSYIYDEILIEPVADVKLPTWLKTKKDVGIFLKRRIHPNMNVWVIGYNQDRHAPKEILDMIKKDPAIKSAEFNIRVKGR